MAKSINILATYLISGTSKEKAMAESIIKAGTDNISELILDISEDPDCYPDYTEKELTDFKNTLDL